MISGADTLGGMVQAYAAGADPTEPYVSPVFGSFENLPPMLIQVGTEEVLFDDSTRVVKGIENANGFRGVPTVGRHDPCVAPDGRVRPRSRGGHRRAGRLHLGPHLTFPARTSPSRWLGGSE